MNEDEQTFIKEFDQPIPANIEKLQRHLRNVSQVIGIQHRTSETFVNLFLYNFTDFPLTASETLNKSNWTHHVYYCIRSTAKTLYLG